MSHNASRLQLLFKHTHSNYSNKVTLQKQCRQIICSLMPKKLCTSAFMPRTPLFNGCLRLHQEKQIGWKKGRKAKPPPLPLNFSIEALDPFCSRSKTLTHSTGWGGWFQWMEKIWSVPCHAKCKKKRNFQLRNWSV